MTAVIYNFLPVFWFSTSLSCTVHIVYADYLWLTQSQCDSRQEVVSQRWVHFSSYVGWDVVEVKPVFLRSQKHMNPPWRKMSGGVKFQK